MSQSNGDTAEHSSANLVSRAMTHYFTEFARLKECGREFWVVQWVNLVDAVAYFAMMTVSTLYLSETLGYNDTNAANLWALCMAVYTATGFVAGFLGDSFGIKRTLTLSVTLLVISRLAISFTEHKAVVLPALFVVCIGTAIMTPILVSATKRYTTAKSQTAGFNLLYLLMNIGAFLGNLTLDPLRQLQWGNRSVFMVGSLLSITCWLSIMFFWRKGISKVDRMVKEDSAGPPDSSDDPKPADADDTETKKWEAPWTIAISVFRESAFWRFMLFLVILVGVRLVFEHQTQVYPKYYQRTMAEYLFSIPADAQESLDRARVSDAISVAFAEQDKALPKNVEVTVTEQGTRWRLQTNSTSYYIRNEEKHLSIYASDPPIGLLNSINPLIICFGVILSTPIVARFKLFNVMFVGIVISSSSMLFLTIYPGWFCDWLGISLNRGYLVIAMCQLILFSIGEMIWSPRLYEYTAAIAPKGREASYMGLSYVPMFFARFAEGPLAGNLLSRYCPPDIGTRLDQVPYSQSPQMMSLILAAIAIATPVLIVLFKRVIQKEGQLEK